MLSQEPNINAEPYDMEKSIRLSVANETRQDRAFVVKRALRDKRGAIQRPQTSGGSPSACLLRTVPEQNPQDWRPVRQAPWKRQRPFWSPLRHRLQAQW